MAQRFTVEIPLTEKTHKIVIWNGGTEIYEEFEYEPAGDAWVSNGNERHTVRELLETELPNVLQELAEL